MVERVFVGVRRARAQVVHVAANNQAFEAGAVRRVALATDVEDAGVTVSGSEVEALEPREQRALPAAAGLRHAVDGLLDDADALAVVFALDELAVLIETVAGRGRTVHHLALEELALEVGRDEVPPVHGETEPRRL